MRTEQIIDVYTVIKPMMSIILIVHWKASSTKAQPNGKLESTTLESVE